VLNEKRIQDTISKKSEGTAGAVGERLWPGRFERHVVDVGDDTLKL
jgi:hypothetical protein